MEDTKSVNIQKKKKRAGLIWLTLLLIIPMAVLFIALGLNIAINRELTLNELKMDSMEQLLESNQEMTTSSEYWFLQNSQRNIELITTALSSFMTDEGYTGPRAFEDGMVVEVKNGRIIYPDMEPGSYPTISLQTLYDGLHRATGFNHFAELQNAAADLDPDTEDPEAEYLQQEVGLCFGTIGKNVYYVDWTSMAEYEDYISLYVRDRESIETAERSLNAALLIINEESEDLELWYQSAYFPDCDTASGIGFTKEMLQEQPTLVWLDSSPFVCNYAKLSNRGWVMVVASPIMTEAVRGSVRAMMVLLAVLVIFLTLNTWLLSLQHYVRDHTLTEEQRQLYFPARVRSRAIAAGLTGMVVIFCFSLILEVLGLMQSETEDARDTMNITLSQLEATEVARSGNAIQEESDWYNYYGKRIASLAGEYPEAATRDMLQAYRDILQVDYIMLFDQNGRETACSGDYIGYTLDTLPLEGAAELQALLHGIPSVTLQEGTDGITGRKAQMIGVRMPIAPQEDGSTLYGALLMSVPSGTTNRVDNYSELNVQLSLMTPADSLCFAADADSGQILYSSDPSWIGYTIAECGLPETSLQNGYTDFATMANVNCYVVTSRQGDLISYFCVESSSFIGHAFFFSVAAMLIYLAAYFILLLYIMKGYTNANFETWVQANIAIPHPATDRSEAEKALHKRKFGSVILWLRNFFHWDTLTPENRSGLVFRLSMFLMLLVTLLRALSASSIRDAGGDELLSFILNGNWVRGFNLFAICSILILLASVFVFSFLIRNLLKLIASFTGRKGETVCRLLGSVIQYGILISVVYLSFSFLGFSPGTIVASVGVGALVLSMGAKDMVTDILAGIFFLFEDQFRVGDIIKIDDFRGTVMEIGVRSTKLINGGGDIRIVSNSNIRNITNKSRANSMVTTELRIAATESITRVEEILDRELPLIGERNEKILSGPFYWGVSSLAGSVGLPESGVISLFIACFVKEEDYYPVGSSLRQELVHLCEREHIDIR